MLFRYFATALRADIRKISLSGDFFLPGKFLHEDSVSTIYRLKSYSVTSYPYHP